jgi:LPS sulfotransferase NodH
MRYIVAASPRTGSYLLCEALEATGIAGRPTEAFEPNFRQDWIARWRLRRDVAFPEFLAAAINHGTTENGVYGLKIHWMHVAVLARQVSHADPLRALFPGARYVHIVRQDTRGQAISYLRAIQTNEWWRIPGVMNHQSNGCAPRYDGAEIRRLENCLRADRAGWEAYFDRSGTTPLTIFYETLVSDLTGAVTQVLNHLGLDPAQAARAEPPRLARQADEVSLEWRASLEAGG